MRITWQASYPLENSVEIDNEETIIEKNSGQQESKPETPAVAIKEGL